MPFGFAIWICLALALRQMEAKPVKMRLHFFHFKNKIVLGWGVPLLCMGFGVFIALTFAGNTCLMIVCICFHLIF